MASIYDALNNFIPSWSVAVVKEADKILSAETGTISVKKLSEKVSDSLLASGPKLFELDLKKIQLNIKVFEAIKNLFNSPKEHRAEVLKALKKYKNKKNEIMKKGEYIRPDNFKKIIW